MLRRNGLIDWFILKLQSILEKRKVTVIGYEDFLICFHKFSNKSNNFFPINDFLSTFELKSVSKYDVMQYIKRMNTDGFLPLSTDELRYINDFISSYREVGFLEHQEKYNKILEYTHGFFIGPMTNIGIEYVTKEIRQNKINKFKEFRNWIAFIISIILAINEIFFKG